MLCIGSTVNGYEITAIDSENKVAMGFNPNPLCPSPYVVWDMDFDLDGVNNGSYFSEKLKNAAEAAYHRRIADKIERFGGASNEC